MIRQQLTSMGSKMRKETRLTVNVLDPSYGEYQDDYADYSYITILVDENADLTALAPEFTVGKGLKLYTSKEEVSGESLHDFSKGAVHYTASAENSKVRRTTGCRSLSRSREKAGFI